MSVLRERVAALKLLWSGEAAEFHGRHVDFGPVLSGPLPVQRPHPPILVGGGRARIADVAQWADGWLPHPPDDYDLGAAITELRAAAAGAGRARPSVTVFNAPAEPGALQALAAAGVDCCLLDLRASDPAEAGRELSHLSSLRASTD